MTDTSQHPAPTWRPPPGGEQLSAASYFDVGMTEKSWHDLMH